MAISGSARIAVFKVRIMGPHWAHYLEEGMNNSDAFAAMDKANQEVVDSLGETLSEMEEKISTLLPEGFYCKIED